MFVTLMPNLMGFLSPGYFIKVGVLPSAHRFFSSPTSTWVGVDFLVRCRFESDHREMVSNPSKKWQLFVVTLKSTPYLPCLKFTYLNIACKAQHVETELTISANPTLVNMSANLLRHPIFPQSHAKSINNKSHQDFFLNYS
jgi:hypothetical protein